MFDRQYRFHALYTADSAPGVATRPLKIFALYLNKQFAQQFTVSSSFASSLCCCPSCSL